MKKIVVIIPAYKETENIQILLKDIFRYLASATVIIVDDSPKNEFEKLRLSIKENKSVTLLSRSEKLGRGSAVLHGFSHALNSRDNEYFFEMDADLAHYPSDFLTFLSSKKKGDLIIGSRYMKGSTITNWPLRRLIFSRIINAMLNIVLELNISDYTNGFRLYNRSAVEFLTTMSLREQGFIALSESAYKLKKAGFSLYEVPIRFTDRKFGKSSANLHEHVRALLGVVRIRFFQK